MTDTGRRFRRPLRRSSRQDELADERIMSLTGHLAELRKRLLISIFFIALGMAAGWIWYDQIFDLLADPYRNAANEIAAERNEPPPSLTINTIAGPLVFQIKASLVAGVILSCPVWLYQIWAFVTPGMMRNERKWALVFIATAVPLFLAGLALSYWVLGKAIDILLGFTPEEVLNLNALDLYLSFVLRMLLVFGVAFELPVFILLLNFAGVVSGARLSKWRRGAIFGIFVFAAIGTPTGDPVTMLLLAVPMWILFEIAVVICRIHDKRKGGEPDYEQWADDEASPI